MPLRAVPREQTVVTVATFPEWAPPATPLQHVTWVSLPDQLRQMCRGKPDPVLAIQQILGLPPAASPSRSDHQWQIVHLHRAARVDVRAVPRRHRHLGPELRCRHRQRLARRRDGAVSPEPALDLRPRRLPPTVKDGRATPDVGYPFTGMGWSYDWNPAAPSHVGISEYVVKLGAPLGNITATTPDRFCSTP